MKVYFSAATRGKETHENYYKKIYDVIKDLGYKLLDRRILDFSVADHYKELEQGGEKAYTEFFDYTLNLIKASDINVFECSVPSLGIGFQVQKSLEFSKPTVVLYTGENTPHFLAGVKDDRLLIRQVTETNLKKVLKETLELAKERSDKRFNFFLSPKLLEYLEDASKKEGVTKSKLIRDMIVEHMRQNTEVTE